jgi:iron(II)-dependent oxidoreductase
VRHEDSTARVAAELAAARDSTRALLEPLDEATLIRQWSPLQSPLVWDLAHIGHFEELWIARRVGRRPPLLAEGDDLYDAFRHVRNERSALPILRPAAAWSYLDAVRERTLETLESADLDGKDPLLREAYAFGLVIQHERQHNETMLQTIQLAGVEHPGGRPRAVGRRGERIVEAGPFEQGTSEQPWAYDNERPAHEVHLAAFAIDIAPVTNEEYGAFVEDGGYHDRRWWSDAGWAWRRAESAEAPLYWRDGRLLQFGRDRPLDGDEPVQHVSFHEAEAYARWAGKRLPSEAEWEKAAKAGALEHVGEVWEWTSSPFEGYPGFRAFPYREYSEVFFGGEYLVLRGGSFATSPLVARTTLRNWDFPIRRQIFSGIRCARDA